MMWLQFFMQGGAISVVALVLILSSCGVKEDTQIKGLCQLKCGQKLLSPGHFEIRPLFEGDESTITCNLGHTQASYGALSESERQKLRSFDDATPFKFLVVKTAEAAGGGAEGGGGEGPSTGTGGTLPDGSVPLGGVSVNVDTSGETGPFNPAPDKTHPDLQAFEVSRYTKTGIATSPDNWCSDTCGVVSVDIHLFCPFPGTEQPGYIYITSGATSYVRTIKVKTADFLDAQGGGSSLRALSSRPGISGWASDLSHFLSRRYWRHP